MMGLSLFEFGPEPDPNEAVAAGGARGRGRRRPRRDLREPRRHAAPGHRPRGRRPCAGPSTSPRAPSPRRSRRGGRPGARVTSIGRLTSVPDGPMSPVMIGRGTTYRFAAFDLPFAGHPRGGQGARPQRQRRLHGGDRGRAWTPTTVATASSPRSCASTCPSACGATRATAARRRPTPSASPASRSRSPGLTPLEHMQGAHELVARWKHEPALRLADPLAEVSWLVPVPMLAQAAQASDVTTSNVPGPADPAVPGRGPDGGGLPAGRDDRGGRQHHDGHLRRRRLHRRLGRRPCGLRPRRPRRGPARRASPR